MTDRLSPEDIGRAARIAPSVVAPGPVTRIARWGPGWLIIILFVAASADLGLDPAQLFRWSEIAGKMLTDLFQPSHGGRLDVMLDALVETFAMGVAGTVLAVLLGFPLGIIGSKTLLSNPIVHGMIRLVYDILRGIPALVWAIIMIRAFGLGPVGGVVALALAEAPYIAKLFAEMIENADRTPVMAARACGASPFQAMRFGLAPQVLPNFLALALFFLEINMRAAAALGIVGAGGIGQLLEETIAFAAFDQTSFLIILLLIMVAVIDTISGAIRRRLVGKQAFSFR